MPTEMELTLEQTQQGVSYEVSANKDGVTKIDSKRISSYSTLKAFQDYHSRSSAIVQFPISDNFCIKGTHMQMIRDNKFDGRIRSDPHRHIANFLEISSLFQYGENQEEAVMLRTFPFSLSGESKTWLNELNEGTITSWNEMREAFIS
ncbi:hypothetical protein Tco_0680799 [Tanacetum coccineum]|uniref:Reverse transcriptase domain-containing protein n=1 Tax=Tanacetum coccineum TaxID=301880 RepID=A0ABQ4XN38_9ASTR